MSKICKWYCNKKKERCKTKCGKIMTLSFKKYFMNKSENCPNCNKKIELIEYKNRHEITGNYAPINFGLINGKV